MKHENARLSVIQANPSKIQFWGSSKSDPKSIAICPGTLIKHLGIIKTPKHKIVQNKKTRTTQQLPFFVALLEPYWDPVGARS